MPLNTSNLSFSQIREYLNSYAGGYSSTNLSLASMSSAAYTNNHDVGYNPGNLNGSAPHKMSELQGWYAKTTGTTYLYPSVYYDGVFPWPTFTVSGGDSSIVCTLSFSNLFSGLWGYTDIVNPGNGDNTGWGDGVSYWINSVDSPYYGTHSVGRFISSGDFLPSYATDATGSVEQSYPSPPSPNLQFAYVPPGLTAPTIQASSFYKKPYPDSRNIYGNNSYSLSYGEDWDSGYTVSVSFTDSAGGSVSGSGTFTSGTSGTINATVTRSGTVYY
jgi:hypothetical protein